MNAAERTGRRNRVRPDGELIVDAARGLFWGNRGALLGASGQPTRQPPTRAWVCCVLEFKGWQRTQWQPGRLTELYFLDEATSLAAGHRPCGLCRVSDYRRFQDAWQAAFGGGRPGAPVMDARLHTDRRTSERKQRTFTSTPADLPDATMVRLADGDERPGLLHNGTWLPWTPAGYEPPRTVRSTSRVQVLTPQATVEVLAAGYTPVLHPSAEVG